MELHSPAAAKRLWNIMRVAFFMTRKGLISKRKLIMDMNMMLKRRKLIRIGMLGKKTSSAIGNLIFHQHHHHHSSGPRGSGLGLREYEFSCSNSPNPVFSHGNSSKRRHSYFPCIHAIVEEPADDADAPPVVLPRIDFSPWRAQSNNSSSSEPDDHELAIGGGREICSLLIPSHPRSVRASNYSSAAEDDDDDASHDGLGRQVDHDAEEFINKFYEQLRAQSCMAMLQSHKEMLVTAAV